MASGSNDAVSDSRESALHSLQSTERTVLEILRTIRTHLAMDVAFVSEFVNGHRVIRYVESAQVIEAVQAGRSDPLDETYCQRIIEGSLPELLPDTATSPVAADLAATAAVPVGALLSVPLRLADGTLYGTFCCFSHAANNALIERDLATMRAFADLTAVHLGRELAIRKQRQDIVDRIQAILSGNALSVVYQPIYSLELVKIIGFESLSRFAHEPARSPDLWFNEAAKAGLGIPLEIKAIQMALLGLQDLPTDVYLSMNISPETLLNGAIGELLSAAPLGRIVLEVTEHASIDRYQDIARLIHPLRKQGLRIAVDDAGAGYASFRHILNLVPDLIKLDVSLTRDIHRDSARRALAAALIRFAEETGSQIIAEGVETMSELQALAELGVVNAQGYLLGRPTTLATAVQWCHAPFIQLPSSLHKGKNDH